jgi:peptide/nickel transport system substrate-binding protein
MSNPSDRPSAPGLPAPGPPGADERRGPPRTLRVSIEGEPAHLNPLLDLEATAAQMIMGTVYEPLLTCTSGGEYRPALADGWQLSPDGLHLTFHLRPGVRWHDGRLLEVYDVQASLEPLLRQGGSSLEILRASLADVATVEVLADRHVRLGLKRPSGFVLGALCDVAILPDHVLHGPTADPGLLSRQPIGTGPFRFAGWERGKRARLVRSSTYWGTPALLDELVFELDPDGARALGRTRRGEIDVLLRVLPIHFPDEVDAVTLHGKLSLWRLTPARWAYVAVNHRRPPLEDPAFRRALSALWDRERFARDLHHGLAHPIGAPPLGGDRAASEVGPAPAGAGAAAAILEAAGYRDGDADGVRDRDGAPIRLTLLLAAGSRGAASEAHAFVLEARRAGILVDTVALEPSALMARVRKADFDLALLLWEGRPDEDPTTLFGSTGAFNQGGYRSAEVDGILEALRAAPDARARQPIDRQLAAVLARDQPVLFLYTFDRLILVASRVHDLAGVGDRVDFSRAWVDP